MYASCRWLFASTSSDEDVWELQSWKIAMDGVVLWKGAASINVSRGLQSGRSRCPHDC